MNLRRRRKIVQIAGSLAVLATITFLSCTGDKMKESNSQDQPNLLFIFTDQQRQQAVGFMDGDPVHTPNLDRLADESLILENAVSNYPLCSPYRGMLLTGKNPHKTGVTSNCHSGRNKNGIYLKTNEVTISDILDEEGYELGYVGKWHLDPPKGPEVDNYLNAEWDGNTPPGPRRHGFDFWYSYQTFDYHFKPHYWTGNTKETYRMVEPGEWSPRHEAKIAMDFLKGEGIYERDKSKPFALFMSLNPPHPPFQYVPEEYKERYKDKSIEELLNRPNVKFEGPGSRSREHVVNYFAAITGIDEQLGKVFQTLEEEGLNENTIVVFTSDHGEMMGSHGRMGKNTWFNESILVPFTIKYPGKIEPRRDDILYNTVDIMPTMLGLLGKGNRIPYDVDGTDYSDYFMGKQTNIRKPELSLFMRINPTYPAYGQRGFYTGDYTFAMSFNPGDLSENHYLYHNTSDPYQLDNMADEKPELVEQYKNKLLEALKKYDDPWGVFYKNNILYMRKNQNNE